MFPQARDFSRGLLTDDAVDSFAAYPSVQLHNTIYVVITQYEPQKVHRLLMRSIKYLYFIDSVLQSQLHG